MEIEDQIDEFLSRGKGKQFRGNDTRGRQALILYQRFKKAKDLEEMITINFLTNIYLIGLITNDTALLSKAKAAMK